VLSTINNYMFTSGKAFISWFWAMVVHSGYAHSKTWCSVVQFRRKQWLVNLNKY